MVTVRAEEQPDSWVFAVQDNGIGIPAEHLQAVFEPFRRLHGMGKYPGTGIGLAICVKAEEKLGGRVWAESA